MRGFEGLGKVEKVAGAKVVEGLPGGLPSEVAGPGVGGTGGEFDAPAEGKKGHGRLMQPPVEVVEGGEQGAPGGLGIEGSGKPDAELAGLGGEGGGLDGGLDGTVTYNMNGALGKFPVCGGHGFTDDGDLPGPGENGLGAPPGPVTGKAVKPPLEGEMSGVVPDLHEEISGDGIEKQVGGVDGAEAIEDDPDEVGFLLMKKGF